MKFILLLSLLLTTRAFAYETETRTYTGDSSIACDYAYLYAKSDGYRECERKNRPQDPHFTLLRSRVDSTDCRSSSSSCSCTVTIDYNCDGSDHYRRPRRPLRNRP